MNFRKTLLTGSTAGDPRKHLLRDRRRTTPFVIRRVGIKIKVIDEYDMYVMDVNITQPDAIRMEIIRARYGQFLNT